MTKGKRPRREAAGGGDGRVRGHDGGGGGYNNGNYQGHGNWGNTPNYPTPHPNYNQNPPMDQGYNQNPPMGHGYNQNFQMEQYFSHNFPMGQGYNQTSPMGQHYNQNPPMGPGYNQNFQGFNQNPQMGQGYNTYQFAPNLPYQQGNEPSNPFSQSHQAPQTQQRQNNDGQQGRRRKKPKKSHEAEQVSPGQVETNEGPALDFTNEPTGGDPQENFHGKMDIGGMTVQVFGRQTISELNENLKPYFNENDQVHALVWKAPVLARGSSSTATPVELFVPIGQRSNPTTD